MKLQRNFTPFILAIFILMLGLPIISFGGTISGTFATLTSCPMNLTCFTVDPTTGNFYGQGDQGSTNYYRYNVSTNTWTTMASCPQGSGNNGGATYLNGKIYNSYCDYTVMTVYDIASNTWSTISGGLTTGCISNDGTDIYISGETDFKKYEVSTGNWYFLSGTSGEAWGGLQYKNGYFYRTVGNGETGFKRYEVVADVWTTLTSAPGNVVLGSAIFDAYYYCQGDYGGTNLYSYDLGAAEWNNTLTLPFTTDDAAIVTYGSSLYIVQGEAGTGFTKFTPNNPMLLNIEGASLSYTIGGTAVNVTGTMTASQNAGTNFQSATVSITSGFQTGKDVLSYVNANGISGSWNSTTGVLTLTGNATIANYQTALRSVKYSNTDVTSTSDPRKISFQVSDGTISSNVASRNITQPSPTIVSFSPTTAGTGTTVTITGTNFYGVTGVSFGGTDATSFIVVNTTTITAVVASGTSGSVRVTTGAGFATKTGFTYLVCSNPTSGGTIAAGQSICNGATPNAFTSTTAASGHTGTLEYMWQYSTTSGLAGFSDISSSNSATYSAGALTTTTWFKRLARVSCNATWTDAAASNVIQVTVAASGGTLTSSTAVCTGIKSTTLTLSGATGSILKWQYSSDNWATTTDVITSSAELIATNLAVDTKYRAVVQAGSCQNNTNEVTVTP